MSNHELETESIEIIKELTRPKPIVHLHARLVALTRRSIHKYLYEHPELQDDDNVENILYVIMINLETALEVISEYDIVYKKDKEYGTHPSTINRKPIPIQTKSSDSNRINSNRVDDSSYSDVDVPNQPTTPGRSNDDPSGNYGRVSSVFKPPRKSEQPERPERRKSNRKSKSKYSDDQP